MFQAGQKIGFYTLVRKLAEGGFGEVWLAEKESHFVTKKVAVKLPHDEDVDFEAIRQEAHLWEQASGHPNVLPLIDADVYDGQVAIVSEYAESGSLADRLKNEHKLSIKESVEMTIGILNGLEYLHSKGIVHRDIKPANILLQGNTPRLADFGISRAVETSTISSVIVGTESYMSPEAFEGVRTVQTDVWSVGVVLYKLLTGNLPFPQTKPTEMMYAVLMKEPEPMPDEIPMPLRKIVFKALEKDREIGENPPRRYQSAAEMREDLRAFLENFSAETIAATSASNSFSVLETERTHATIVKMKIPVGEKPKFSWQSFTKQNFPKSKFSSTAVLFLVLGLSGLAVFLFANLLSQPSASDSAAAGNIGDEQSFGNINFNSAPSVSESALKTSKELYRAGDRFFRQKKYARAIESYTKAIELNPDDFGIYNNRGIAYHATEEFEKAIADYNRAAELNPRDFSAYNNRGAAYEDIGKIEQAIADYRKALELDPDNKTAKNNLNKILK